MQNKLNAIQTFIRVAEAGSFSAAARQNGMKQSAVSQQIAALEEALGKEAVKNMMPIQPGDVLETSADTKALYDVIGFKPQTSVKEGVKNFVDWYRNFYNV